PARRCQSPADPGQATTNPAAPQQGEPRGREPANRLKIEEEQPQSDRREGNTEQTPPAAARRHRAERTPVDDEQEGACDIASRSPVVGEQGRDRPGNEACAQQAEDRNPSWPTVTRPARVPRATA